MNSAAGRYYHTVRYSQRTLAAVTVAARGGPRKGSSRHGLHPGADSCRSSPIPRDGPRGLHRLVVQELAELLLFRAVGAFDLPIRLRRPRLDVDTANALIRQVPLEEGFELMPPVGADRVDAEGEAPDG